MTGRHWHMPECHTDCSAMWTPRRALVAPRHGSRSSHWPRPAATPPRALPPRSFPRTYFVVGPRREWSWGSCRSAQLAISLRQQTLPAEAYRIFSDRSGSTRDSVLRLCRRRCGRRADDWLRLRRRRCEPMDLKQDGADGNHQDREVDQKLHGSVRAFELTHGAKRGDRHACSGQTRLRNREPINYHAHGARLLRTKSARPVAWLIGESAARNER